MLHQVNKLQFEATCATEAQAFELRHNFSSTRQDEIAAIIDKVCSQYTAEDEWIKIDRIEVDLDFFNIQSFENIFTSLLQEKFEKGFLKKVNAIPAAERSTSKETAYIQMLFHFLQTGTLPWWAGDETISIDAIFIEVIEQKKEMLHRFLQEHKMNIVIWKRMAMQFSEAVQERLISLFPELVWAEKKIEQWVNFLNAEKSSTKFDLPVANDKIKNWRRFIFSYAPEFFNSIQQNNITLQTVLHFAVEFKRIMNNDIAASAIVEKIMVYEEAISREPVERMNIKEQVNKQEAKLVEQSQIILAEKFTVHTAGTVLLAPYFKQLFTQLHLLEHGEWKNAEAHYKAIHLIRYMATGQLMCAEHTLVMEKLLCGMDITAPIPREVLLTNEEKNEATALLKAVITHWAKLKNTSIEGLRETFLKREGILTKKENGWLLQVEKKTADVLLESIPWSYGTLAFSWNNYIIFTEW